MILRLRANGQRPSQKRASLCSCGAWCSPCLSGSSTSCRLPDLDQLSGRVQADAATARAQLTSIDNAEEARLTGEFQGLKSEAVTAALRFGNRKAWASTFVSILSIRRARLGSGPWDGTILATANGGATWTPQTSGTEADLRSVSFVDAQTGWAVGSMTARSWPPPMVVPHGRPRPAGRRRGSLPVVRQLCRCANRLGGGL